MFLVDFYFEAENQSNVDFIYYFDFFLLFIGDLTRIIHFFHIWYVHNFTFSIVSFLEKNFFFKFYLFFRLIFHYLCY